MKENPKTDQAVADDRAVDTEIAECLDLDNPKSFFLFAGAGSGKTRSLVTAMKHVQQHLRRSLEIRGQKVAVITYTNAARDEIEGRLFFDPMIDVRTIHSFSWSLIKGLDVDIRDWLRIYLRAEIVKTQEELAKGRGSHTKAYATRTRRIEACTKRLDSLVRIRRFIYSPTGDNRSRDSLSHAEVIKITSSFLVEKASMRSILVGRYPILLIDESQDTNRHLVDALFEVQAENRGRFVLGLFGDMMQRIYTDGKDGLGEELPDDWATPSKQLNYRSPARIVSLINKVRSSVDAHSQEAWIKSEEGVVRLFVVPVGAGDKFAVEGEAARRMGTITGDALWNEPKTVKTLTLEHRMAASRMGFLDLFEPLYSVESWRTGFLNGDLPVARFFSRDILPLVRAGQNGDRFEIARISKALSPLLQPDVMRKVENPKGQLARASQAIDFLLALFKDERDPSLLEVLRNVAESNLLQIPESLRSFASDENESLGDETHEGEEPETSESRVEALAKFLAGPFSQLAPFSDYFDGSAHFDTHQGVKGLEFDRVMVIMDDDEARGFSFKYEDLFGGKTEESKTVAATRRLFYVTSSRAMRSLALVAYTVAPDRVRDFVLRNGWFSEDEIVSDLPLR